MPTYSITPKGTARLEKLAQRFEELQTALSQVRHVHSTGEHFRSLPQVRAMNNFVAKYSRQLSVLHAFDNHKFSPHEAFHWNREYPLSEGYIRVYNRAKDKAIHELLRDGYIEQVGG